MPPPLIGFRTKYDLALQEKWCPSCKDPRQVRYHERYTTTPTVPSGPYMSDFIVNVKVDGIWVRVNITITLTFLPNLMMTAIDVVAAGNSLPTIRCPNQIHQKMDSYTINNDGVISLGTTSCLGEMLKIASKAVGPITAKLLQYNKSDNTIWMKADIPKIGPRHISLAQYKYNPVTGIWSTPPPLPDLAVCGPNLSGLSTPAQCKSGECYNCCSGDRNYYCCSGGHTFSNPLTWCSTSSNLKGDSCHKCPLPI